MSLEVKVEEINILDIVEKSDLSSENKKLISESDIVLLPATFSTSHERGNFSSETPDFIKYIRTHHPEIKVSLFENTGEEKIQDLRDADIIIPIIYSLVQNVPYDLIIGIVGAYLYDKLKGDPKNGTKRVDTEFYYNYTTPGKAKRIMYKGPVSGLKNIEKIVNSDENK